jgi:putative SOS response-associated peptidase YedK
MCGRYVAATRPDELARYFDVPEPPAVEVPPSWNVAPTQDVYVVVEGPDGRRLDVFRWGLVPLWAKDAKVGNRMINARADTLAAGGAFTNAFERRRCLVPADGFYEWRSVPGQKRKTPVYIARADGEPLAFAGLWERWRGPDGDGAGAGRTLYSTTIVTTDANATVAAVHDRMPVILPASTWDTWLDRSNRDLDRLADLLVPAPDGLLVLRTVGPAVSDVNNDGPELVDAADPPPEPDHEQIAFDFAG